MLIMAIDKIFILLDQASQIEMTNQGDAAENEPTLQFEGASEEIEEAFADTPAYRELAATLDELTPEEVYELLAVAAIGDSENAEESWELAVRRAQSVAAADALDELARILVLTDAIENGLDRLRHMLAEDLAAEDVDEDEDEDDRGEAAGEEEAEDEDEDEDDWKVED